MIDVNITVNNAFQITLVRIIKAKKTAIWRFFKLLFILTSLYNLQYLQVILLDLR